MSLIQKIFVAILPKPWAEKMKAESEKWQIRCLTCGKAPSIWEVGGIRWKAGSVKKHSLVYCSTCGKVRQVVIERAEKTKPHQTIG